MNFTTLQGIDEPLQTHSACHSVLEQSVKHSREVITYVLSCQPLPATVICNCIQFRPLTAMLIVNAIEFQPLPAILIRNFI